MEDFRFKCDHCGLKIETSTDQAGEQVICPGCHEQIQIPESPAVLAIEAALPPRTIPMAQTRDIPRDDHTEKPQTDNRGAPHEDHPDESPEAAPSGNYKVVPIALSPEEEKTPASVARKVERTIQAFSVGGWRFSRIDAITYETKGALGVKEEIVHLAIFTLD